MKMGKGNITLLLVTVLIFLLLSGYGKYCAPGTSYPLVNVDSIQQAYNQLRDSIAIERQQFAIRAAEKDEELRQAAASLYRANEVMLVSNKKVKQLIAENKRLRAENDSAGLISNCNELVDATYDLTIRNEDLSSQLEDIQVDVRNAVSVRDSALAAADRYAQQLSEFTSKFRQAVDSCNARGIEINRSGRITKKEIQKGVVIAAATLIVVEGIKSIIKKK